MILFLLLCFVILVLFFSFFGAVAQISGERNCPYCQKIISKKAIVCPYCRSDIEKRDRDKDLMWREKRKEKTSLLDIFWGRWRSE